MRCNDQNRLAEPAGHTLWRLLAGLVTTLTALSAPLWSQDAMETAPFTVTGRVINGLDGAAIPRALVSLEGRAVLTNAMGVFEFQQFTKTRASISVTKPGFAQSRFPAAGGTDRQTVSFPSSPELKLYPDAIVTGSVLASDGVPLERTQVEILRRQVDQVSDRMAPVGFVQTDSHGGFRFEEPPGEYRLHLMYSPQAGIPGEVMLPLDSPEQTSGDRASTLKAQSGQEIHVDLRPHISKGFEVGLASDRPGSQPRIFVTTSKGITFNLAPQPSTKGELTLILPSGSYRIRAVLQERGSQGQSPAQQEAEVQINLSDHPLTGVALRFSPTPTLPIEMIVEGAAQPASGQAGGGVLASAQPSVSQLNLRLQTAGVQEDVFQSDSRINTGANGQSSFLANPGVYRLRSAFPGNWYVRAASYGTTDLLTSNLVVGQNAGGQAIRLFVSNAFGQVTGTVRRDGLAVDSYVAFIAREPSLNPVQTFRAGSGTYTRKLPPGTYTVVALDRQFAGDLSAPEIVVKLTEAQTVQISAGSTLSLDLKPQSVETLQ